MQYDVKTVDEYLAAISDKHREALRKLRQVVIDNLPEGFEECISYKMISYVIPLARYPKGYHVTKGEPLPFLSIASQKNHIAFYHMGMYVNKAISDWFVHEYSHRVKAKLDMGKSCIRLTNPSSIHNDVIAELSKKMTGDDYIDVYERQVKRT